jgi:hypothetical protein
MFGYVCTGVDCAENYCTASLTGRRKWKRQYAAKLLHMNCNLKNRTCNIAKPVLQLSQITHSNRITLNSYYVFETVPL